MKPLSDTTMNLPELPARTIPTTGLRPKKPQSDKPLELELPMIAAKEPTLFDPASPYEIRFKVQTFTVHDSKDASGNKKRRLGQPLRSSEDIFRFATAIYETLDADKEHFVLLAMNNKNRLNGYKLISTGTLTASLVHPREVFRAALAFDAAAIAFVHNHPSGDPAPSPEDIEITRRLKECAEIFGIRCLDHVILGDDRYFSFNDKGMM